MSVTPTPPTPLPKSSSVLSPYPMRVYCLILRVSVYLPSRINLCLSLPLSHYYPPPPFSSPWPTGRPLYPRGGRPGQEDGQTTETAGETGLPGPGDTGHRWTDVWYLQTQDNGDQWSVSIDRRPASCQWYTGHKW